MLVLVLASVVVSTATATATASTATAILPAAQTDAFVYVTTDSGQTWNVSHTPFSVSAVCSYEDTLFVLGYKKISGEDFNYYAARSNDGECTGE